MPAESPALVRLGATFPVLDAQRELTLVKQAKDGDRGAVELLVLSHMRLVSAVARRYARHGVSVDDLVGEGTLGLLEAIRRFDASKGNRLSTYAGWWIRAYVRRYALANRRIIATPSTRSARKLLGHLRQTQREISQREGRPAERHEIAAALGVAVDEVVSVETALGSRDIPIGPLEPSGVEVIAESPSPEQQAAEAEVQRIYARRIDEAFAGLSAREREVVLYRHLDDERPSLAVLGERFGVSRERVRQIQKKAESKLRTALLGQVA